MDETTAQQTLETLVHHVREMAPIYSEKMKRLDYFKTKAENLINEEFRLKQSIKKITIELKQYKCELNKHEQGKSKNMAKLENAKSFFTEEVIKNAKISITNNQHPLILGNGRWNDITLNYFARKSQIIRGQSEILKKMDRLRHLQQNVFCLYDNDLSVFDEDEFRYHTLMRFLINPESDFSEFCNYFKYPYSTPIKQTLLHKKSEFGDLSELVKSSISYLSKDLSEMTSNSDQQIDLSSFCFSPIHTTLTEDTDNFSSQIHPLINQIHESFEQEKSNVNSATKTFFQNNPQVRSNSSVLCSNIIFKAQEQLQQVQKHILEISQQFISPENKSISEILEIDALLNEIYQTLTNLVDKYKSSQIITQRFSIQEQKAENFQLDVISPNQIRECQQKLDEMRSIIGRNLENSDLFINEVHSFLEKADQLHKSKPFINLNMEDPPLKLNNDDNHFKKEFLELRDRIIQKQSEQLDEFTKMIEELPPEIKQVQFHPKDQTQLLDQISNKTGFQFPSEQKQIEIDDGPINIHTSPYLDSNQTLFEQLTQHLNQSTTLKLNSKIKKTDESINFDDITDKYVKPIDEITEELNSHVSDEEIPDLIAQRKELLETLKRKKEELTASITQKSEKNKFKISEMEKLKIEQEKNLKLKESIDASTQKLDETNENLKKLMNTIDNLKKENDGLKEEVKRCNLRQTRYKALNDSIAEMHEKEKQFNDF